MLLLARSSLVHLPARLSKAVTWAHHPKAPEPPRSRHSGPRSPHSVPSAGPAPVLPAFPARIRAHPAQKGPRFPTNRPTRSDPRLGPAAHGFSVQMASLELPRSRKAPSSWGRAAKARLRAGCLRAASAARRRQSAVCSRGGRPVEALPSPLKPHRAALRGPAGSSALRPD